MCTSPSTTPSGATSGPRSNNAGRAGPRPPREPRGLRPRARLRPTRRGRRPPGRRTACQIPEDLGHVEKWQLAPDMLDETRSWGIEVPLAVADPGTVMPLPSGSAAQRAGRRPPVRPPRTRPAWPPPPRPRYIAADAPQPTGEHRVNWPKRPRSGSITELRTTLGSKPYTLEKSSP
ncbi:transposase [Streptomyces atratus]|uniref:transposase n=1 Tax=Streptomyces atratus TaxID=1893 RepID=UPI00369D063C